MGARSTGSVSAGFLRAGGTADSTLFLLAAATAATPTGTTGRASLVDRRGACPPTAAVILALADAAALSAALRATSAARRATAVVLVSASARARAAAASPSFRRAAGRGAPAAGRAWRLPTVARARARASFWRRAASATSAEDWRPPPRPPAERGREVARRATGARGTVRVTAGMREEIPAGGAWFIEAMSRGATGAAGTAAARTATGGAAGGGAEAPGTGAGAEEPEAGVLPLVAATLARVEVMEAAVAVAILGRAPPSRRL
mmetsp:Transcript_11315/g.22363  ORF Transcript_11315/g.22363 Transcript_11315/m.22363 type:complete len:263 (+) Transcript_11315:1177-1965(+)